jgi:hypothetical protein
VTFKDLRKRVSPIAQQQSKPLFQRLRNRRFWIWNEDQHKQSAIVSHGDCCFNHIIGLPRKEGIEKPIFDYQKLLYDNLMIPAAVKNQPGTSYDGILDAYQLALKNYEFWKEN